MKSYNQRGAVARPNPGSGWPSAFPPSILLPNGSHCQSHVPKMLPSNPKGRTWKPDEFLQGLDEMWGHLRERPGEEETACEELTGGSFFNLGCMVSPGPTAQRHTASVSLALHLLPGFSKHHLKTVALPLSSIPSLTIPFVCHKEKQSRGVFWFCFLRSGRAFFF